MSRGALAGLLVATLGWLGCHPAESAQPAAVDGRDQYEFVSELLAAQAIRDRDERALALDGLASAWQKRRYQWEARLVPPLCSRADRCLVLPFDYARFDRRVVQGWMPTLEFEDASELDAGVAACAPYDACIVSFEGMLSGLRLSVELPTNLAFSGVRFIAARAEASSERWLSRSAR